MEKKTSRLQFCGDIEIYTTAKWPFIYHKKLTGGALAAEAGRAPPCVRASSVFNINTY